MLGSCGTGTDKEPNDSNDDKTSDSNDYKEMIQPNNELGFTLMGLVEPDDNHNIFISPTSLLMALSMVYNGADGETKAEIASALQVEGIAIDQLNEANASLLERLNKNTDEMNIRVANSIWLNEMYEFQDTFRENNESFYQAKIEEIDVTNNESVHVMNNWIKNATNEKITEIVEAPLHSDLITILINAIYFKGNWKYAFSEELTEEKEFHLADGTTEMVPFMVMQEKELSYMENDQFQKVVLPYGKDEEMRMHIFLPKEGNNLQEFRQTLTRPNWEKWDAEMRKEKGALLLPKFQLEYEVQLNEVLKTLGMNRAFGSEANFKKMIKGDTPVWIDTVKQKTFIDVNEKGTEAAAATSVQVVTESFTDEVPFRMEVNRPFFIAIQDNVSEAILFMGEVAFPVQNEA